MKITINNVDYDVVFNYSCLKKIEELTKTSIFEIGNLPPLQTAPIYLASGIFGGAIINDRSIKELPVSVDECEDYFNHNDGAFLEVSLEMNKSLTNSFTSKNDKGVK